MRRLGFYAAKHSRYLRGLPPVSVLVLLVAAFILKVYLASSFEGYKIDVVDFKIWSQKMYEFGPLDFYSNVWSDYPPVYMYVLGLVGWFYKTFFSPGFDISSPVFTVLIKLPAILADLLTALILYKIADRYAGEKASLLVFAGYAFNPAVIYTSSVWGQIDSFYTLFLFSAVYLILNSRPGFAGVFLAVAVLTKPQGLVILPFMALLFILCYKPRQILKTLALSTSVFLLLAVPPYIKTTPLKLVENYAGAYGYYAYNSINAFNFWAFLGFWKPDSTVFILSYRTWGYIFFAGVYLFAFYYVLSQPDKNESFYLGAAFVFFGFFMVFTRIHERYIFPVLPLLAAAMARDKKLAGVFTLLTFTVLFNLHYVLQFLNLQLIKKDIFIPDGDPYVILVSTLNGAAFIYLAQHLAVKIEKAPTPPIIHTIRAALPAKNRPPEESRIEEKG